MILKHLPNLVSFFRLFLIIPFLGCLYHHAYPAAFYLFFMAGLSDGIDGWLARQFHWQTAMGLIIDPLADKLLITSSVVALALLDRLPWWLVILIFARDLCISLGVLGWYYWVDRHSQFLPSKLSKMNTALQIILVGLCLIDLAFHSIAPSVISGFICLTAITTAITYVDYARKGFQHIWAFKCQKTSVHNSL